MNVSDIAKVKVNWMERSSNDPHVTFVLKRDRQLAPREERRYQKFGDLFVSIHENEVDYLAHDRNDHNGFGGYVWRLRMVDGFNGSDFKPCKRTEPQWGSGGGFHHAHCYYETDTNTCIIKGPWLGSPVSVERVTGIKCINIATLEGPSRNSVAHPKYFRSMRKLGRAWDGTAIGTTYTLDFAREVIDRLKPEIELWEGDYGWTVKWRDMPPKNPRKRVQPVGDLTASADQCAAIYA